MNRQERQVFEILDSEKISIIPLRFLACLPAPNGLASGAIRSSTSGEGGGLDDDAVGDFSLDTNATKWQHCALFVQLSKQYSLLGSVKVLLRSHQPMVSFPAQSVRREFGVRQWLSSFAFGMLWLSMDGCRCSCHRHSQLTLPNEAGLPRAQ
jgi:hypothetical protein